VLRINWRITADIFVNTIERIECRFSPINEHG
jgi:hypothetical protein